jgi:hypothetical protein
LPLIERYCKYLSKQNFEAPMVAITSSLAFAGSPREKAACISTFSTDASEHSFLAGMAFLLKVEGFRALRIDQNCAYSIIERRPA